MLQVKKKVIHKKMSRKIKKKFIFYGHSDNELIKMQFYVLQLSRKCTIKALQPFIFCTWKSFTKNIKRQFNQ